MIFLLAYAVIKFEKKVLHSQSAKQHKRKVCMNIIKGIDIKPRHILKGSGFVSPSSSFSLPPTAENFSAKDFFGRVCEYGEVVTSSTFQRNFLDQNGLIEGPAQGTSVGVYDPAEITTRPGFSVDLDKKVHTEVGLWTVFSFVLEHIHTALEKLLVDGNHNYFSATNRFGVLRIARVSFRDNRWYLSSSGMAVNFEPQMSDRIFLPSPLVRIKTNRR